jgi:hypothetical protein
MFLLFFATHLFYFVGGGEQPTPTLSGAALRPQHDGGIWHLL